MTTTKVAVLVATRDVERADTLLRVLAAMPEEDRPDAVNVATWGPDAHELALRLRETLFATVADAGTASAFDAATASALFALDWLASHAPADHDLVFLADDAIPTAGWLRALRAALEPEVLVVPDFGPCLPTLSRPIGIVVPTSNLTRSAAQRVELPEGVDVPEYARQRAEVLSRSISVCEAPDDLAVYVRAEALADAPVGHSASLFLPGAGRLAFTDLALRLADRWTCVVARGSLVLGTAPERSLKPTAPESVFPRAHLYAEWPPEPPFVVATIRATFARLRDLALLRACVARAAQITDSVVVLLLSNPLDVTRDPEFSATAASLTAHDRELLAACSGAGPEAVARSFEHWMARVCAGSGALVRARVWNLLPSEANERAVLAQEALAAASLRPGNVWCLALAQYELPEEGVTRASLARLAQHPNPVVAAYDVAILTAWDAPRSIREDAPWGDGGTNRGGPSSLRFFRCNPWSRWPTLKPDADVVASGILDGRRSTFAPLCSEDTVRVSGIRLISYRYLRPADRGPGGAEEGMRISTFNPKNRIGLHMLTYEREAPEDVARWLDVLHGVVDAVVLVWTGSTDVESGLGSLATVSHGAVLHLHPLDSNLAAARNSGIDVLEAAGVDRALFFDPDEWLPSPTADVRALRRMAESTRLGWLVQVANYTEGGPPTISDSIRMSAIKLRQNGRVHESFGDAIQAQQAAGVAPRIGYAPFLLQHRGMALGAVRTAEKLDQYEALLRLELAEHPENCGAWVSLGWHYANDGHQEHAEECFRRAVECAGTAYLPFRELGLRRLREARALFEQCVDRLAPSHQYARHADATLAWLRANAPEAPTLARDNERPEPAGLPAFRSER